jgi:D-lactate dehydrogenase
VAEFAFALLLTLSRKMYPSLKRVKEQGKFNFDGLRGFDLKGKTLGVVGTGHIGTYVVKIAVGFGMNVIAYDPFPNEKLATEFHFTYVSLEDLLAQSDVITLHVPYMPATHHLINSENVKKIKRGAVLINTARGPLVETQALVWGLRNGIIAGAGLDVLEEEGFVKDELEMLEHGHPAAEQLMTALADHELMTMDNVVITPHNTFQTSEAIQRILNTTVENIKAFVQGSPTNVVKSK